MPAALQALGFHGSQVVALKVCRQSLVPSRRLPWGSPAVCLAAVSTTVPRRRLTVRLGSVQRSMRLIKALLERPLTATLAELIKLSLLGRT